MINPKHLILIFILTSVILLLSCKREGGRGLFCIKPKGGITEKTIYPAEFSAVSILFPARTFVHQGQNFSVRMKGEQNIIDNIDFEITDGELKIKFDRCVRKMENLPELYITCPYYSGIALWGSGSIECIDTLIQPGGTLTLELMGSGDLHILTQTTQVNSKISGSGSIRLQGACERHICQINGSGDMHSFSFPVDHSEIDIKGSGNAHVQVKDYLQVKISSSGNVYYKGDPRLSLNVSGSGKVRKVE